MRKLSHNFSCNFGSLLVIMGFFLVITRETGSCQSVHTAMFEGNSIFFLDTYFRENLW